ncbi:hypothetical protein EDD85DRAFT_956106 [Armillaria nabsnona]|nr:hypothetical protein EDD85DRAFT_956106 [Armillaria nabsnona]
MTSSWIDSPIRWVMNLSESLADLRKREDHRIVFTHADLVRRNIIIGTNDNVMGILDWAMAAFMPEQWEYLKTLWVTTRKHTTKAFVYQITGFTATYEVKLREEVPNILTSSTYMGMTKVESILSDQLEIFQRIIRDTPVTLGSTGWDCRHWVISTLKRLQNEGYNIEETSFESILHKLEEAKVLRGNSKMYDFQKDPSLNG